MTIKRGGVYRGMFGDDLTLFGVTKIQIADEKTALVSFVALPWEWTACCPWLWFLGYEMTEPSTMFATRLNYAPKVLRPVDQVEVHSQ